MGVRQFVEGGINGETLPVGDNRPLNKYQLFEYWEAGYRDALAGEMPYRWRKLSWPEDGRMSYYQGYDYGKDSSRK